MFFEWCTPLGEQKTENIVPIWHWSNETLVSVTNVVENKERLGVLDVEMPKQILHSNMPFSSANKTNYLLLPISGI